MRILLCLYEMRISYRNSVTEGRKSFSRVWLVLQLYALIENELPNDRTNWKTISSGNSLLPCQRLLRAGLAFCLTNGQLNDAWFLKCSRNFCGSSTKWPANYVIIVFCYKPYKSRTALITFKRHMRMALNLNFTKVGKLLFKLVSSKWPKAAHGVQPAWLLEQGQWKHETVTHQI